MTPRGIAASGAGTAQDPTPTGDPSGEPEEAPAPAPTPDPNRPGASEHLTYVPALDGIRGIAVAGVLLFHSGFEWMTGGFLGVSTFFTLSGFLITRIIVDADRVSWRLRDFWFRRFRRLMPAALLALGLTVLFGATVAGTSQLTNLRGDLLWSLGYGANWRFLQSGATYGDVFGAPSPLLHFWSLAIEEQFYLLYPLVVYGVFRLTNRSVRVLTIVVAVLSATSVVVPLVFELGADRVYFGTDTRAAELLTGCLLSLLLIDRPFGDPGFSRRARQLVSVIGGIALVVMVGLWVRLSLSEPLLYQSGLALYSFVSAAVILAAITPGTLVARCLAVWPLRWLGRISYGVYLYHWPIYLWLSPDRTGLDPWPLLVLRLAVTTAVSVASYFVVEMPIRRGSTLWRVRPVHLVLPVVTVVVVLALIVTASAPAAPPSVDASTVFARLDDSPVRPVGTFDPPPFSVPADWNIDDVSNLPPIAPSKVPSRRLRVLTVGDSTAWYLTAALDRWSARHDDLFSVFTAARIGCGLVRGGSRLRKELPERTPDECNWDTQWPWILQAFKPDIVVVATEIWDVTDHRLAGDDTWRGPGDPIFDARLRSEYGLAADLLSASGAAVLWLDGVPFDWGRTAAGAPVAANDPARMDRLNQIIADTARARPSVRVVPYRQWLTNWPGGAFDTRIREDGVHAMNVGADVLVQWLGPELLAGYWDTRPK